MLFRDWNRFVEACKTLCDNGQRPTRACLRWRNEAALLVVRVTDDCKTLTFKARSSAYLNRFELLNRSLLSRYQNRQRVTAVVASHAGDSEAEHWATPAQLQAATSPGVPNTSGAAVGGTNESKPKRKGKKKAK
ncbi:hypothetical protein JCM8547_008502 [Rhodosporidiobolus lusitaniae]